MEIIYIPFIEKMKGRKREDFKATWIITPAKLIYPGEAMKKLMEPEEYTKACNLLDGIFDEIKTDSGVDLLDKAKLYRVDVTKDISTPSEEFSQEVIRFAKVALVKYGYRLWKVEDSEERKEEWKDENGVFYNNDHQKVQAKIYNKAEDLRIHGHDTEELKSLLRFELALKRTFLKKQNYIHEKYITTEELAGALKDILIMAPLLMQEHIADPLWSGAMISRELKKKLIKRYCGCKTDSAKYNKMIAYRKACNRAVSMENVKDKPMVREYFRELGLSPLCTKDAVGYVPAFGDLLAERENEEMKRFVNLH